MSKLYENDVLAISVAQKENMFCSHRICIIYANEGFFMQNIPSKEPKIVFACLYVVFHHSINKK